MDEPERKRRGPLMWLGARTWRFWVVLVAVPFLYVGSLGPALWLYFNVRLPAVCVASIELFYLPIDATAVRFESAKALEDWYLAWWVDRSRWPVNVEPPARNGPTPLPM